MLPHANATLPGHSFPKPGVHSHSFFELVLSSDCVPGAIPVLGYSSEQGGQMLPSEILTICVCVLQGKSGGGKGN